MLPRLKWIGKAKQVDFANAAFQ